MSLIYNQMYRAVPASKPRCQCMSSTWISDLMQHWKEYDSWIFALPLTQSWKRLCHCTQGTDSTYPTWREQQYLHWDSCSQKFVHLCLCGGIPNFHSKDRDKVRADHHVKSVIEEKSRSCFLQPVLHFPRGRKTVDSTDQSRVLSKLQSRIRKLATALWISGLFLWSRGHDWCTVTPSTP